MTWAGTGSGGSLVNKFERLAPVIGGIKVRLGKLNIFLNFGFIIDEMLFLERTYTYTHTHCFCWLKIPKYFKLNTKEFPQLPRHFRKCLGFPQLPRQFAGPKQITSSEKTTNNHTKKLSHRHSTRESNNTSM